MYRLVFVLLMIVIQAQGGERRTTSYKNLQEEHIEAFWNLDPYCLESLCACFSLHQDHQSYQRLASFFPELSTEEINILSRTILSSKNPQYRFSVQDIEVMKKLSLPGISLFCSREIQEIVPDEDLAQALILAEFPGEEDKVRHYTCYLDILALRAYVERKRYLDRENYVLGSEDYHRATIDALNTILFYEEEIRYPSKNEMFADEFSFLSSVADRKFGVCLGVSSLYLSLAQRLFLPLEPVTPPGHIYLRYGKGKINIETTAGGRHLPTEQYCDCISEKDLKIRSYQEIVGLTFINKGSFALQKQCYSDAGIAYEKAREYVNDREIEELLGIVKILNGEKKEGEALLKRSSCSKSIGEDYLRGNLDIATLKLLFMNPGTTYEEVLNYEISLKRALQKFPKCMGIYRRLASVAIHLGKIADGVALLEQCSQEEREDIALHLKLCKLFFERHDYVKAQRYFLIAQKLLDQEESNDKFFFTLYKEMRQKILSVAP
ncbi:transglutaminase family protein [Chlamydia avium]|uniref:Transglutaminase-like superfamily protein n=1 Tax=Chlamydia avium 10DC88 TaxID=1229831 RepID=W8K057_9CHLA|nr:transglutaminase family protein [Chlamydia avium]AHK63267.1 Transglutaminase-like superfamily protein [Chlamydia avium 10DC88]